ncbi:UDP-N-acetylglucosamine--undecaprenyl-phosphate N-acetylglucosaminephosphotransferase [Endozoicomonas sp. G2_1]|uniref:UDP-N-acetylglucosamine--undecaprenyl-phosphate N-acetylglucosaminephosphotransferase n=1 Tax=Endozoicomonas sp. G2_1 TaxID=2821091 RepID=UPI001ADD5D3E|nr:UDP-N-acetylglucosamine--undecaprenyl-phosphate N-acetylglucosaminephosphotransferase [Endozoicomonas sp. G2_1]MBO9488996.1 UDP-N-acetylglucosamine--undecaprenyl-phosphate N-acetylglucosaminephosphotransferase [Endozoicomonas sp. G2_1]
MNLFITLLTSFIFAYLAIKVFKPVAINVGLVDKPNERKHHSGHIPLIGGISIFIAVLFSSLIWLPNTIELRMYLIASAMMVFIGAIDDKKDISVRIRIVGQIIIASLMIYGVGAYISNLGNLFTLGNINLGVLGIFFTYFCIIVTINAFNMIDGIDGLIGSLSINTFVSIAILFLLSGNKELISYPLILAVATLPYLMFNLGLFKQTSRKIFMGDAGSMFIGLSVIWLLTMGTQGDNVTFRPVTALWITAVPLMDMLAIVMRRVRKGQNPFKPDRDHLHHIFMRVGFSDRQALAAITALASIFSLIGILGEVYLVPEWLMLFLFLVLYGLYNLLIKHIWQVTKLIKSN